MRLFLVFPNHLYESTVQILKEYDKVYLIEEPMHFYDFKYRAYRYNKIKLAYLRASMQFYYEYLKTKNINVEYINFDQVGVYDFLRFPTTQVYSFDTFDREIDVKFQKLKIKLNTIIDTPAFISTKEQRNEFATDKANKNKKNISNADYFKFLKQKLNIFVDVKSYDTENRNPLPSNHLLDTLSQRTFSNKYYDEAIRYIDAHPVFKNNIGTTQNVRTYPVTFQDAKKTLTDFLSAKLSKFGTYQDSIAQDHVFLYHSCLSSSLNIGLITPLEVISRATKYYTVNKSTITINNIEAFIRQVLGWREYMWFIYDTFHQDIVSSNYWENKKTLNWDYWYGKKPTGIVSLDNEISKCVDHAYAHHIVRLMVFLNILVLCDIHPQQIKRWFMEVCAIDAYEWIMVGNIWAMGHFTNKYMKKPYLATENYMLNMSDYKQTESTRIWSAVFYDFLWTRESKLKGTASIYTRNLAYFKKLDKAQRDEILKISKAFKKKVSYPK